MKPLHVCIEIMEDRFILVSFTFLILLNLFMLIMEGGV